jgi:hypothetical protein
LAACPGPRTCKAPVDTWGAPGAAPSLTILSRALDGTYAAVGEGGPVDLTFPVQGGHVLFIGARILGLGACGDELSATLKNPATSEILAFETRSVDFTVGDSTLGGTPDLSDTASVANVPACPDIAARDVLDTEWVLEVMVTDKQKKVASASKKVLPRCRQVDAAERAACECECRGDYYLGKCGQPQDGGTDGG